MNKNDLIYKRTARRIIESPRSREQMLSVLDNTPPVVSETEEEAYERGYTAGQMAQCKKDTIQKFHDYQVEWLLSHCDLELEPQLEEWVVRFLHDTANCYMMEIDRSEGEQE